MKKDKVKRLLRVGVFSVILSASIITNSVYAEVGPDGADDPYGTFYNDGTYEYDYGLNIQMSNKDSFGRWINYDLDNGNPNSYFDGNNRRDRWTEIRNSDRRGWWYDHSEWINPDTYYTLHKDGYNEYIWDGYNAMNGNGYVWTVQDGGSAVYWGNNTWNRYRRVGIMVYKRELPSPFHGTNYISGVDGPSYVNGDTVWIRPEPVSVRTYSYDKYNLSYGQNAQYAANVMRNYIWITGNTTDFIRYTDGRNADNWYDVYGPERATGTDRNWGMRVYWKGKDALPAYNNWYYNGMGSEMTVNMQNGDDIQVKTDAINKYWRWTRASGWNEGFGFGSGYYTWLKADGDGPSAPSIKASRTGNWANSNVDVSLNAHGWDGRSGTSYSQYRLDGGNWQTYTGLFTVWNEGWHNVTFRSIDNLGNIGAESSIEFGIDKTSPGLDNYSISGTQYFDGTSHWVRPMTNVSVYTRWSDWVSGNPLTYIRNFSWDGTIDNRSSYNWDGWYSDEWMKSSVIKIPNVSTGYNTANVKDNTWTIQPQNVEQDYYIQSASYDRAWNLADYRTLYQLRVDGTKPYASSMEIKNVTPDGFDIYLYGVGDARSGVEKVLFPTWTDANGQDDIIWHSATNKGGGTWYAHVNRSEHKNEFGMYTVHAYVYDNVKNEAIVGGDNFALAAEPELGGLSVTTYDYKQNDSVYWSKLGNIIGIKTDGYFPSSFNLYPTRTYVLFGKDGAMNGNSGRQYATTAGSYVWGSEYSTYFNLVDSTDKATQAVQNSRNYLTATHRMRGRVDATAFKLFHTTTYIYGGTEYFKPYADSGIWIKVDGTAPTYTTPEIKNISATGYDIFVNNVADTGGSGVNSVTFETWTSFNGIDDKVTAAGQDMGSGIWKYHVDRTAHNNEYNGYITKISFKDNVGNITSYTMPEFDFKADLVFKNIKVYDSLGNEVSYLYDNKSYTVKAELLNDGYKDISNFYVDMFENDMTTRSQRIQIATLNSKQSTIVSFNIIGKPKTAFVNEQDNTTEFKMFADSTNIIDEYLENNNTINTIKPIKPLPDLIPVSVEYYYNGERKNSLIVDRNYVAKLRIRNIGTKSVAANDSFQLNISLGSAVKSTVTYPGGIKVGEEKIIDIPLYTDTVGPMRYIYYVDSRTTTKKIDSFSGFNDIFERIETNNNFENIIDVLSKKVYSFSIYDIRDPQWKDVFRTSNNTLSGYEIMSNQMPVDDLSHPLYSDYFTKKGYSFYYKINSVGFEEANDYVEIIPKFYYYSKDRSVSKEIDIYYEYNNELIKLGSTKDTLSVIDDNKHSLGSLSRLKLNTEVRELHNDFTETWYGKYFIPANAKIVEKGKLPTQENILKDGYLSVNFKIDGYKNSTLAKTLIDWTAESNPKSANYKPGDVMLYDNVKSALDDYNITVTH